MTYAKRNFDSHRRLSKSETAALAQEVLERARQALHKSQAEAGQICAADKLPFIQAGQRSRPARQIVSTIIQPGFGATLAVRAGANFEWLVITVCMIFTVIGRMIHLSA